jgi:hypothetical protein
MTSQIASPSRIFIETNSFAKLLGNITVICDCWYFLVRKGRACPWSIGVLRLVRVYPLRRGNSYSRLLDGG